jgi:opacity protein-like surface antigen
MKRVLFIALVGVLAATATFGQEYKKFKVGLGLGYAVPSKGSGGVLLYVEPMYRIQDNLTVGLRLESAALVGDIPTGATATLNASAVTSYTLNGQYYFGSGSTFRPFAGVGLGMFSVAAATTDIGGTSVQLSAASTSFGFYPRVGFDMGHFNLSIDYNLIPEQTSSINLGGLGLVTSTQNLIYIGIRVGASIGGGKI